MRTMLFATCIMSLASNAAAQVTAESAKPSTPSQSPTHKALSVCEGLSLDWRSVEIELAESSAEELGDNSAPRATMRAVRNQNSLLKAELALQLMRENKCSLPKRAPSGLTYTLDAMKCATEKLKGNFKAAECDYSNWKPIY